jgi:hypothetical protein
VTTTSVLRVIRLLILFIAAAGFLIQVRRKPRVRQRLVTYWWIWLPIAVVAVVGNELVDRDVAGDKNGHPLGDVVIAIVLVGIVFYVSGFVARRGSRKAP